MIRTVPTGDLGLDVLTGGGWRLVKRFKEHESATVVVRGGAGSGKPLMGIQIALELARALGGDVAVGCVEILPTEYIAQLQSARSSLDASRVVQLPAHAGESDGPRVFVGLLSSLDPEAPDLVGNLEELASAVALAGGRPVAFVVDSLIDGYGIGSSIDRIDADAVVKFAAQAGYGLVLCEETATDAPSPWVFAADTVLQLGVESRESGRWMEVRKHRFGPSATGRHELDLAEARRPRAFPRPRAWAPRGLGWILDSHGWHHTAEGPTPPLLEIRGMASPDGDGRRVPPLKGLLVFVSADDAEVAQSVASNIRCRDVPSDGTLLLELDPLFGGLVQWFTDPVGGAYVPSALGPARSMRTFVERFAGAFVRAGSRTSKAEIERVLLGDLGLVLTGVDANDWADAIRTFAGLVIATGWAIPVIAYDGRRSDGGEARARICAQADVSIDIADRGAGLEATINERWPRRTHRVVWKHEIARQVDLDETPRPFGRNETPWPPV